MGLPTKLILFLIVRQFYSSQLEPSFTFYKEQLDLTTTYFSRTEMIKSGFNTQEQSSKKMASNFMTTKENAVATTNTNMISPGRMITFSRDYSITFSNTISSRNSQMSFQTVTPDTTSSFEEGENPMTTTSIQNKQISMESYTQLFYRSLTSSDNIITSGVIYTTTPTISSKAYVTNKISFLEQGEMSADSLTKGGNDDNRIKPTSPDIISYNATGDYNITRQWFSVADNESNLSNYRQDLGTTTSTFVCEGVISSCINNCGMQLDSCSCDIYCEVYNVCCDDFQDVCHQLWSEAQQTLSGLLGVEIECIGEHTGYLVIAGCSLNATNLNDRTKCGNDQSPALSIDNLHFKNKFCLRCNGYNETLAEEWSLTFFVTSYRTFPSFLNTLSSTTFKQGSSTQWIIPDRLYNMTRVCTRRLIEDCPVETDKDLREKCLASKADVVVKAGWETNLYKNIYCAKCHVKANSMYTCSGTTKEDYGFRRGVWRFSEIVSVSIDEEGGKFHLTAKKPFIWKRAQCFGKIDELNCNIIECHHDAPLISNTCGPKSTDTCVGAEILLPKNSTDTSNCSSSEKCIKETVNLLAEKIKTLSNPSHLPKKNVTFTLRIGTRSYFNVGALRVTFYMVYTSFNDPFPFTAREFYDLYVNNINGLIYERGFRGEFSLCVEFRTSSWFCGDQVCTSLNYTRRTPYPSVRITRRDLPHPDVYANGGRTVDYLRPIQIFPFLTLLMTSRTSNPVFQFIS